MVNNNLVGGDWNNVLSFNDFPYLGNNGMSSSQLTNSIIFFKRGRYTTNQLCVGEVVILITTHIYIYQLDRTLELVMICFF